MSQVLSEWLQENGKTQRWLADQCDVQPPSVNEWLKTGIPTARVPFLSGLTGISVQELWPDEFPDEAA